MRNDYDAFLKIRAADLQARALVLAGESDASTQEVVTVAASVDDSDADPSD